MIFKRIAEAGPTSETPDYAIRKAEEMHFKQIKNFKRAIEKGVKIAVGTDGYSPHLPESMYYDELLLMEELGMSKLAVLQAATIHAAEALGLENQVGSIEVGKKADLVVLSSNPLENIDLRNKVKMVIKDGKLLG